MENSNLTIMAEEKKQNEKESMAVEIKQTKQLPAKFFYEAGCYVGTHKLSVGDAKEEWESVAKQMGVEKFHYVNE